MTSRRAPTARRSAGFLLLPVVLTLGLLATIALTTNRDSGNSIAMLNARADQDRARYAAEAGLQHAAQRLQQIGCAGPYPQSGSKLTNGAFGAASYTAHADRASGTPVVLSATGSYNGASVTLTRTNVHVHQATVQTFVVQPDRAAGKDTYVSPTAPTANYGGASTIRIGYDAHQTLIQFPLVDLPPGSRPVSIWNGATSNFTPGVQMSLYQTQFVLNSGPIAAQLVTRPWLAGYSNGGSGGATWNTSDGTTAWPSPGVGFAADALVTTPNPALPGWQNWDLTDTANAWFDGTAINHGVWLTALTSASSGLRYVSADDGSNLSYRPKMTFNYLLPCGMGPPQKVTIGPSRDTEIDSTNANSTRSDSSNMAAHATHVKRALLSFSLSSIPSGKSVTSATLRLYVKNLTNDVTTTTISLTASALTQSWSSEASWNRRNEDNNWSPDAGGSFRASPAATTTLAAGFPENNWVEFDLSALVREWLDGVTPNYGVIIQGMPGVNVEFDFATLNDNESWRRPDLVVTYR